MSPPTCAWRFVFKALSCSVRPACSSHVRGTMSEKTLLPRAHGSRQACKTCWHMLEERCTQAGTGIAPNPEKGMLMTSPWPDNTGGRPPWRDARPCQAAARTAPEAGKRAASSLPCESATEDRRKTHDLGSSSEGSTKRGCLIMTGDLCGTRQAWSATFHGAEQTVYTQPALRRIHANIMRRARLWLGCAKAAANSSATLASVRTTNRTLLASTSAFFTVLRLGRQGCLCAKAKTELLWMKLALLRKPMATKS